MRARDREGETMTDKCQTGYKWLTDDMRSVNGNESPWKIGVWKKIHKPLEMCKTGFHASENPLYSLEFVYGDRFFVVEAQGTVLHGTDKFVASEMRIVKELPAKEIMVKFVIACAKNCLFRFEQKYPDDKRPRNAIEVAEKTAVAPDAAAIAYAYATAYAASPATYAVATAYAAAATADAATYAYATSPAIYAASTAAYAVAAATTTAASERKWQRRKLEQIIARCGGI